MDSRNGTLYHSYTDMEKEIGAAAAMAFGVVGSGAALKKLQHAIRAQLRGTLSVPHLSKAEREGKTWQEIQAMRSERGET